MFQFRRFPAYSYLIHCTLTDSSSAGFPHSDIHGSRPAFGSPWLFVDRYVLLRLPVPRHPPCALLSLTSPPLSSRSAAFLSRSNHARITFGFFLFSQNYSCYPISFAFTFVSSSLSSFQGSRVGSPPLYCIGVSSVTTNGGLKWTRTIDLTLIRRAL